MTDRLVTPVPAWRGYLQRNGGWLAVALVLVLVAVVRLRLRDFPLERDEGEYAYAGQLILQGVPPYQLAYNMKFPGTYAAYAAIMAVFGQTPAGIHLGVTCVTTLTALLLYLFIRRRVDEITGVAAAASCAVLSACPSLLGLAGHATHFAALFITAGVCLLWPEPLTRRTGRLVASGLMFGVAVLMKQHAAILCAWGLGVVVVACFRDARVGWKKKWLALAGFCFGAILPFGVACLALWRAGVFETFWFWTITYAREYVSEIKLSELPRFLQAGIAGATDRCLLIWLTAVVGLVLVWFDGRMRQVRPMLTGWLIASFLATCPGFYFRNHYFLVMVPALSLLAGCAVSATRQRLRSKGGSAATAVWPAVVYGGFLIVGVMENANVWFAPTPFAAARRVYGSNPFPEAETVAAYIRDHSAVTNTVAVLGSEPEIYFLSHRRSATSYLYTFALMEAQPYARRMQEDMIRQLEAARPEFVVHATSDASWWESPPAENRLLSWWTQSYKTNYVLVGAVRLVSPTETRYFWGDAVRDYVVTRGTAMLVFQRGLSSLQNK